MLRQRASRGVRTPLPFTHSVCGNRQGLGTVRPSDCSSRGSRAVVPWPQFQAIRLGDSLLGLARRGVCSPHRRAERLAASGYGSSTETVAQLGSEKCVARTGPSSLVGEGLAPTCRHAVAPRPPCARDSYLVDPASSHMLVSKTKPCMSKYKPQHGETANGSLNQLWFLRSYNPTWITVVILELIHASKLRPLRERALLLDQNQSVATPSFW
jgi:hypothetical protein